MTVLLLTDMVFFLVAVFFLLSWKGFVSKLDEFIHWLNEAMETTENWTPPKAETDSLKLYLETHLVGQHYTMIQVNNLASFQFYLLIKVYKLCFEAIT